MRPSYCLEFSYQGTDFFGWQSQPHGNTVQDCLERAITEFFDEKVRLVAASRTDTGVHADQQFAVFRLQAARSLPANFIQHLNQILPASIRLKSIAPAAPTFHPSRDAVGKIYRYRLELDASPTPVAFAKASWVWRIYRQIDLNLLSRELMSLVGTHDFTSFCAADSGAANKVRTIDKIEIERKGNEVEIWFYGSGFLKQMLRIIVGTVVEFAGAVPGAKSVREVLAAKDRRAAGRTAPARGLTLMRVNY